MRRWQPFLELFLHHAPTASPLRLGFPLGCSRRLPLVVWHFPFSWSWFVEDRVVFGSMSWQSRLSMLVLGHFFFLGVGLGLDMRWAGVAKSFNPTIAFKILLFSSSDGDKGFDVLGPMSWPVKPCSPRSRRQQQNVGILTLAKSVIALGR